MTNAGPTILSLTAAGLYCLIVAACITASITAAATRQADTHWRWWALIAGFFTLLIIARLLNLEHEMQDRMREAMRAADSYGNRRTAQAIIAAVLVAIAAIIGGGWLYRTARHARGRREIGMVVAQGASMAMAVLIGLRLVSFHAVDALLYGPLKLNWIIDLTLALMVGLAAFFYIRALRQRRRREPGGDRQ